MHGGDACDFDEHDTCRECGVVASECETCGGVGYHREGCADSEGGA
jgi:hypothetical protein